jgi:hypothetical protein
MSRVCFAALSQYFMVCGKNIFQDKINSSLKAAQMAKTEIADLLMTF